MKFQPHHFPNGTVFEITDDMLNHVGEYRQSVFKVVNGIARNGFDSYVLKTGVMRELIGETGFNIDHVKVIVKRGSGPVVIDHGWYGFSMNEAFNEDIRLARCTRAVGSWKPSSGYHNTVSPRAVIQRALVGIAKSGMTLDYERLLSSMLDQTWCRSVKPSKWYNVRVINKKRLRRWLKANVNRFLIPHEAVLKAEEEESQRQYDRQCDEDDRYCVEGDRHYDDLHEEPDFPDNFLTNLSPRRRPVYEEAVRTWKNPEDFEVRDGDGFGVVGSQCSLFCKVRGDLSEFWRHFEAIESKMSKQVSPPESANTGNQS